MLPLKLGKNFDGKMTSLKFFGLTWNVNLMVTRIALV